MSSFSEEYDRRRLELLQNFNDQKILLLGMQGAGKSSLINSLFFVANAKYTEEATVGSESRSKTRKFSKYSPTVEGKSITLLDACGLPPWRGFYPVVRDLVHGRIRRDSNVSDILANILETNFDYSSYEAAKVDPDAQMDCVPSVALVLLNGAVDGANEIPEGFLHDVNVGAKSRPGLPVFVIATRCDEMMNDEMRKRNFEEVVRKNIECEGFFFISNYLPYYDLRKYPEGKQLQLIEAFLEILREGLH
eukprot:m.311143 g.311143  ORF g.311143 m.311143 type:complete len:249 (+) comp60965_c0_seq1:46-792(+)